MWQVETNLASPSVGQGGLHRLQSEHTSEADLAQEEKGGKNQAPADIAHRDALGISGRNQKIFQHNRISGSTLTLPHIQLFLKDMMQKMNMSAADSPTSGVTPVPIRLWFTAPELGHPLIDDNHDRPLPPLTLFDPAHS